VKDSKTINSPILMQSDSMTATDYSKSSQLRAAVGDLCSSYGALLPASTFEEDCPCSQSVVSPCQRADNTNPPKVDGLEGHKLSNILCLETALQQQCVPPGPQPLPCCGCQAPLKAGLQIPHEGPSGLMWSLLAFSPTHTVPAHDTKGARAGPVTMLRCGLPAWGLSMWWHHLIKILPIGVIQRPGAF